MYNDENKFVADMLKKLRIDAGFSQQNMADALDINRSTYSYYELGKTKVSINYLKKISKILGVSFTIFFEEEDSLLDFADNSNRRPGKIVDEDPQNVGGLSNEEKSIVAMLRLNEDLDLQAVINALQKKTKRAEDEK